MQRLLTKVAAGERRKLYRYWGSMPEICGDSKTVSVDPADAEIVSQ